MVIAYLEKIRDNFIEERLDIQSKLAEMLILKKENEAFIHLLEENTDSNFEVFTPRTVNSFHKKKIEELNNEQNILDSDINKFKSRLQNVEDEINEINLVIKDTKEKLLR